ncbi:hypothetical protein [Paenibacillus pinistramenti]|uniref:hypothetical protein n=1 Tax=Paenibacillus pinistramenti TaxID=1768003 RepID=UPI00193ABBB7|nr:hypothetical protein [Paenibacillus pinistramenti]
MLWSTPLKTNFPQNLTEEERKIMLQHISYWTEKQNQGIALVKLKTQTKFRSSSLRTLLLSLE